MQKYIFFDLDGTIYDYTQNSIPSQTIKLIQELSLDKNNHLGLCTGRSLAKINVIDEIIDCFEYLVLLNGAYVMTKNEVILDLPLDIKAVEYVISISKENNYSLGLTSLLSESFIYVKNKDDLMLAQNRFSINNFDTDFYKKNKIYQMWVIFDVNEKVNINHDGLKILPWSTNGLDIVNKYISKKSAIDLIIKNKDDIKIIAVGDGYNDIEMLKMSDISISMGNSRFNELKELSTYVAPNIKDNKLYDFFKEKNLI